MDIVTWSAWLQKNGNAPAEYEDAFAARSDARGIRLAIADGATETSFAGLWARQLVKAYCRGQFDLNALNVLRRRWLRMVCRKPLPWYAEEKLRLGAYAACAGLTLEQGAEQGSWQALAIGDSCLFQIRAGELILAWPLQRSEQFNDRPALLGSLAAPAGGAPLALATTAGSWQSGDWFYLMTDALACWFLSTLAQGVAPLVAVPAFEAADHAELFAGWIAAQRASGALHNDDVTWLRARIR